MIEINKNNPRFPFSILAKLTESQIPVEPRFPLNLTSNELINFFTNKILTMRENLSIYLYLSAT